MPLLCLVHVVEAFGLPAPLARCFQCLNSQPLYTHVRKQLLKTSPCVCAETIRSDEMEFLVLPESDPAESLLGAILSRLDERNLVLSCLPPRDVARLREVCHLACEAGTTWHVWASALCRIGFTATGVRGTPFALIRQLQLREPCGFELTSRSTRGKDTQQGSFSSSGVAIDALNPFDRPAWLLFAESVRGGLKDCLGSPRAIQSVRIASRVQCRGFCTSSDGGATTRGDATTRALGARGELALLEFELEVGECVQEGTAAPGQRRSPLRVFGLLLPPRPSLAQAHAMRSSGALTSDPSPRTLWDRQLESEDPHAAERRASLMVQRELCDGATITIGKHILEHEGVPSGAEGKPCLLMLDALWACDLALLWPDGSTREIDASHDLSSDPGVALSSTAPSQPARRRSRASHSETGFWRPRRRGGSMALHGKHSETDLQGPTLSLGHPSELRFVLMRASRVMATMAA